MTTPGIRWKIVETAATAVLIPIGLGVGAWIVQWRLQKELVRRDYVQLATSILSTPDSINRHPALRSWATDVLSENSPTTLPDSLLRQLRSGDATLPGVNASVSPGAMPLDSLLPNVRVVAIDLLKRIQAAKVPYSITKTLVGREAQNRLLLAGLTTDTFPQNSHNRGIAFDVTPEGVGMPSTADSVTYIRICQLAAGLALDAGLARDKPYIHFEYKQSAPAAPDCTIKDR